MILIGTTAAILAVILWTVSGTINKRVATGLGTHLSAFLYVLISIIPVLIATTILGVYSISFFGIWTAVIAGIFLAVGFILGFRALQTENLSSVSALQEIMPATLLLFGLFILGEKINTVQFAGIAPIFLGTLMIITTEKLEINKKMLPAVLAVVAWSIYWMIISYSVISADTYALPILISRLVSLPVVLVYLLSDKAAVSSLKSLPSRLSGSRTIAVLLILVSIASLSDASGDTIFGITSGSPVLAIGAALVALQPMAVSFLAFVIYKDKLTRLQLYGLLVMLIGALVLSA